MGYTIKAIDRRYSILTKMDFGARNEIFSYHRKRNIYFVNCIFKIAYASKSKEMLLCTGINFLSIYFKRKKKEKKIRKYTRKHEDYDDK